MKKELLSRSELYSVEWNNETYEMIETTHFDKSDEDWDKYEVEIWKDGMKLEGDDYIDFIKEWHKLEIEKPKEEDLFTSK